jgi:putative heme-binding domain-containing protein
VCGHLGFPNQPAIENNFVQLRLAEGDEVVAKSLPPRSDTAQRVEWDLTQHSGKRGYLELVDRLDLNAYAWLAVARFEPPVVQVPSVSPASVVDRQVAAASVVASLNLPELRQVLLELVSDRDADWRARQAAAVACLARTERPLLAALCALLAQSSLEPSLREEIAAAVSVRDAEGDGEGDGKLLAKVMQAAPAREQRQVADALAATAAGSAKLLQLVERGHAAARLLQDRVIRQKLAAHGVADLDRRLAKLTASLPTVNVELDRLIDERRRAFASQRIDPQRGQEMFAKHCAACHQVRGQGSLVGPQLDGIGNRGAERVIEDVLDPNRNVDATFQVSILTLADGRVVTGLVRREEGEHLILADQQGKEFTVPKAHIEERSQTNTSLMPANVPELIKPDEFYDLIGYMLTLRAAQSK